MAFEFDDFIVNNTSYLSQIRIGIMAAVSPALICTQSITNGALNMP